MQRLNKRSAVNYEHNEFPADERYHSQETRCASAVSKGALSSDSAFDLPLIAK
jgi:hypothetical protein